MSATTRSVTTSRRVRALLAATTLAGLAAATLGTGAAPAASADPGGDCAVAFPVAEVHSDDLVHGSTVTHGTDPEPFTGKVLGVVEDGIAPDVDMVMVRLTSDEIDKVGIWQGMSGSPVYAEDGRLIGAVAYGLATGPSPVAGVTPFEKMDDLLGAARPRVPVGPAAARQIARHSDVSVRQAAQGFEELPMPVGVAGVGAAALARLDRHAADHRWATRSAHAAGRASAAVADETDIVAGGNLGASMTYGDVTMAGIGTVTSVCGDRVVGFGHPMNWSGDATLGLHPADAVYIQEDMVAGFKVANLAPPVGTITDDRLAGIAGTLGPLPDTAELTVGLTHGARSRTGITHIADRSPDTMAYSTLYGVAADHVAVVDGAAKGTEVVAWSVAGTDGDDVPFTLSSGNRYTSSDLAGEVGFSLGDLVYGLAHVPGIAIDSISVDGTLTDTARSYAISKVEVRQGGAWVQVTRRSSLVARAGSNLTARVTLTSADSTRVVGAHLAVPAGFSGQVAGLMVVGGRQVDPGRMPRTVAGVQEWLAAQVRNDQLQISLTREGRASGGGAVGRGAGVPRTVQTVVGPVNGVVRGRVMGSVVVR